MYVAIFTLFLIQNTYALSEFSRTKIAKLIIHDSGDVIVLFKSNVVTGERCQNTGQVVLQRSDPFYKDRYAALLSAFHGQTTISGYVNGCSTEWQSKGTAYLIRIDLEK